MTPNASPSAQLTTAGTPELEWRLSVRLLRTGAWQVLGFASLIAFFSALALLYFLNLARWSQGPDFGWSVIFDLDRTMISQVHGEADKAGLRVGDRIVTINGLKIARYSDLQRVLERGVPGENIYTVDRAGESVTVTVPNRSAGWPRAFERFGLTWTLSVGFFVMGAVAYAMKPGTAASWAFLIAAFHAALWIMFSFTSRLSPAWLSAALVYAWAFLPAAVLHLAQAFPVERAWFGNRRMGMWLPYLLSAGLLAAMLFHSAHYADVPKGLQVAAYFYWIAALAVFLVSTVMASVSSSDPLARARSRIVLLGTAVASLVPAADLIAGMSGYADPISRPTINLVFFVFFPLSIAYAIIRHNLFDVDVYIRRAVGYGLMTAIVATGYLTLQGAFSALWLGGTGGTAVDGMYPVVFALLVVFLFNPLNRRIQAMVDRLFFRGGVDYKRAVSEISQGLASLLTLPEVISRLLSSVSVHVAVEGAGLILLNPGESCQSFFSTGRAGAVEDKSASVCLSAGDALLTLVARERQPITLADLIEAPRFRTARDSCLPTMLDLGAALVLPLVYKDRATAVLTVGRKKSGQLYTREEVDFLRTLASQGAVTIENAKMAEALVEQERMRRELELAREIQTSLLPKPREAGFPVVGINRPAMEVSGDFYDYFELPDGRIGFALGDVSGKGLNAALLTAKTSSLFHCLAKEHHSPGKLLAMVNNEVCENVTRGMFVTMVGGFYDPATGRVTLANAGHQPPLYRAADGRYTEIATEAPPLGILPHIEFAETELVLNGGGLYMFTDGLTECWVAREQPLETAGVQRLIDELHHLPATQRLDTLVGRVLDANSGVSAHQNDDLTLLIVEAAGS
ncbi:MAG: hypothetical protein A3E57_03385 [Candidatus Muproteobacteria bacterium RIFCSPHIGHO2_12_FULL_60_33]|nr:MAG: hypothetical protein A3E57_03385 [Candidatus Muproteobacteria bacterium RIFCSPHIGHO2_12_FULL_60_33]